MQHTCHWLVKRLSSYCSRRTSHQAGLLSLELKLLFLVHQHSSAELWGVLRLLAEWNTSSMLSAILWHCMTRFPEEDIFDTAALTRSSEVKYSIDTEALTRSPRQVSTVKPPLTDTFRKRTLPISGNVSTGSTFAHWNTKFSLQSPVLRH